MRTWWVALAIVVVVASGCTGGADGSDDTTGPAVEKSGATTLASLGVDWPAAAADLDPGEPPRRPDGFDAQTYDRMTATLTAWAQATTTDDSVWHSGSPADTVEDALPDAVRDDFRTRAASEVSPRLAVANVFVDGVDVGGPPRVTTAWRVEEREEGGRKYVVLELQTRAAYQVRAGDDGPARVIGVLRVHGLSAFSDTTDEFGLSGGWQEFGAGGCALALDDALEPDGDVADAQSELETFVRAGESDAIVMPRLGDDERVDEGYLARCEAGRT